MKTVNYVIVEIDNLYNNTEGGIIINDSIENVENINRTATVVSAPDFTMLESGDTLMVHHNIFKKKYDVKGKQINSNFWIEDNKYFVPLTEIFMYKRDSDWISLTPFCFVIPIRDMDQEALGFQIKEDLYKGMVQHKGVMLYSNTDLDERGISVGDTVMFSKNSEYEFKINNVLCYKMKTKDILGIINERII
jgi:co-chaperonin GroES (HSP10)